MDGAHGIFAGFLLGWPGFVGIHPSRKNPPRRTARVGHPAVVLSWTRLIGVEWYPRSQNRDLGHPSFLVRAVGASWALDQLGAAGEASSLTILPTSCEWSRWAMSRASSVSTMTRFSTPTSATNFLGL